MKIFCSSLSFILKLEVLHLCSILPKLNHQLYLTYRRFKLQQSQINLRIRDSWFAKLKYDLHQSCQIVTIEFFLVTSMEKRILTIEKEYINDKIDISTFTLIRYKQKEKYSKFHLLIILDQKFTQIKFE